MSRDTKRFYTVPGDPTPERQLEAEPVVVAAGVFEDDEDKFEWRLVRTTLGSLAFEYRGFDAMGKEKWEPPLSDRPFGEDYQGAMYALAQYIYEIRRS